MLYFPFPLDGRFSHRGYRITLISPFVYRDLEKDLTVEVPKGFISDFNSIPWGLWNHLPPWMFPEAGVVHDWLYKHPQGFYRTSQEGKLTLNRSQCDDAYRRILDLLGASWTRRNVMWSGLRAGGWKTWQAYRDEPLLSDSGKNEPKESQKVTFKADLTVFQEQLDSNLHT